MKTFVSALVISRATVSMRVALQVVLFGCVLLNCERGSAQGIQLETQELVFAHLAVGGGWESDLTLVAQGAEMSSGTVKFLTEIGGEMIVSVNGGPEVTSAVYNLAPGASERFRLTSNGPTNSGWAIVTSQMPANGNHGSINGVLTYRCRVGGVVTSQVGILPSQAVMSAHLPFDETDYNNSTLAIATLNRMDVIVDRYREDGEYQESTTIHFMPHTKQAMYVRQLFPGATGKRGSLLLKASAPFNLAALNVNNDKWSGLAGLPGIFERDLTLSLGGVSNYRVRLIQNGNFLYGTAQTASSGTSVYTPVSGSIARNGERSVLQLNMHTFLNATGQGLNIILTAPVADIRLGSINGRAVAVKEDGDVSGTGTFTLNAPSGAQF